MNDESAGLIGKLAQKLKERGIFMCTAESCTGGLIAAMCTDLAGSSEWFKGGVVSYSNELKERLLGVPGDVLDAHGAVSIPVVEAMAAGALGACAAQASVAVSGVAGPGGGSPEKPVGTVCIAAALRGPQGKSIAVTSRRFLFEGKRAEVREAAAKQSLEMLLELLN